MSKSNIIGVSILNTGCLSVNNNLTLLKFQSDVVDTFKTLFDTTNHNLKESHEFDKCFKDFMKDARTWINNKYPQLKQEINNPQDDLAQEFFLTIFKYLKDNKNINEMLKDTINGERRLLGYLEKILFSLLSGYNRDTMVNLKSDLFNIIKNKLDELEGEGSVCKSNDRYAKDQKWEPFVFENQKDFFVAEDIISRKNFNHSKVRDYIENYIFGHVIHGNKAFSAGDITNIIFNNSSLNSSLYFSESEVTDSYAADSAGEDIYD